MKLIFGDLSTKLKSQTLLLLLPPELFEGGKVLEPVNQCHVFNGGQRVGSRNTKPAQGEF